MAHRIRHAMAQEPVRQLLKGKIEVDETYVGGKPRKENKGDSEAQDKPKNKRGRGT